MTAAEWSDERTPLAVCIVGLGYVGLPLAVRAAEVGFAVTGIDLDPHRIATLRAGQSYVEDVPAERLQAVQHKNLLRVAPDYGTLGDFDVAVITVPTPLREGIPDLSYVKAAGQALAPHIRRGCTVVLESTTYPGTTTQLLQPLLESGSGLKAGPDFHLGYSPERIDPGNRRWTLETTPKIVSGIDALSLERAQAFYAKLCETVVAVSSPAVAEIAKLLENTFRHVNIALVNEMAIFSRELGINIWEAIDAAATKPFGFMRFTPGPGVGGHCLPIDPAYLSWHVRRATGRAFRFVEVANDINSHMPDYVVHRLLVALNDRGKAIRGARIVLLGLAYKKNTSDARESPTLRIIELLTALHAKLFVSDSLARDQGSGMERTELTKDLIRSADAVVLVTDHDDVDYDMVIREASMILDCRNRLSGAPHVIRL